MFRAARATSPPVSLDASPYPGQDITTLRSNINCLTADYRLLKTSFIDRASPKHLRKNIAAFENAILEAFGDAGDETAQPGFVLMKLTSRAFKLSIKIQAGDLNEAKKSEIEEEFTELSIEYEKYRVAFETLRSQLEKSNRGPRAFYLYGVVGVHYEVIGNQNFDASMVSAMPTLEHGEKMGTANQGKKRGAEEENVEHHPPSKRARGGIPKQVVEVLEVVEEEEEDEEEEVTPLEPAKRTRRSRVTTAAKPKASGRSIPQRKSTIKEEAREEAQANEDESGKSKKIGEEKEVANEGQSVADAEVVAEEKAAGPRRSARVPKANKKYM